MHIHHFVPLILTRITFQLQELDSFKLLTTLRREGVSLYLSNCLMQYQYQYQLSLEQWMDQLFHQQTIRPWSRPSPFNPMAIL